jgi:hypothetical protein
MNLDFIYASTLKSQFACYGHFYEMELMTGETVSCRSVLEIVTQQIAQTDPSGISRLTPDAVVIMMNPGSSHPKDASYKPQTLTYPQRDYCREKELVLTQPDNTQYQIMRVAIKQGWHHIRVLNLSDLRDPKSGRFLQRVAACAEVMGGHTHSIFCDERIEECNASLRRKTDEAILLGWGQDMGLLDLAENCVNRIQNMPVVAVPSSCHPLLNAHPSPMMQKAKLAWLERIFAAYATKEKPQKNATFL